MGKRRPTVEVMELSDVRGHLNNLVNCVYRHEARVVVEKSGIPVAGIVSADDLARLDRLDRERAERFAVIDEMRAAFQGVPADEIEREAERSLAEVRDEHAQPSADTRSGQYWTPTLLSRAFPPRQGPWRN